MTAKRFTVDDGLEDVLCWEINDKENENMTCGECAKLLNELHETNEQLQHDATILIQSNQDYRKENEQLKKEIENLKQGMIHAAFDKEWK
jgi:predicted RNase H-like nuclease (RuvC/YqgF family)